MNKLPKPNFTLHWTDRGMVQTRKGPRLLAVSQDPPKEFWAYWKDNKETLANMSVSVKRDDNTGRWLVLKWTHPSEATAGNADLPTREAVATGVAMSRTDAPSAGFAVPFPEGITPYPFQLAGIEYAEDKPRVIIADEMGLGKTLQAIGLLNLLESKNPGEIRNILIVCPASLKINWAREWEKFSTLQHLSVGIVEGTKNGLPNTDVVIINYDILYRPGIHNLIINRTWDHVIVDEAHYVKNPKTRRSEGLLGYPRSIPKIRSNRWTLLTGTPVTNRPADGWNLFRFCAPTLFGKWMPYALRYCNAVHTRFGWDYSGSANLPELQTMLRGSCLVRRLKSEVMASLPSKVRQVIEIPCPASVKRQLNDATSQWELAKESIEALRQRVANPAPGVGMTEAVAKLREAEQVAFSQMSKVRAMTGLAKVDQAAEHILDLLDSDPDLKIVVGAHHKEVIANLSAAINKKGYSNHLIVQLTGDMPSVARQSAVDSFQRDPKVRVFIGSILAAGTGITLTASSTVVMVEYDWVPASNQQFEDRCHRIGQSDSVLVQYLVAEGTLDAKIARDVAKKIAVLEALLDKQVLLQPEVIDHALGVANPPPPEPGSKPAPDPAKRARIDALIGTAQALSVRLRLACKQGLDHVHALNSDRASVQNGVGFSKFDTQIGERLATSPLHRWSEVDIGIGFILCRKYRRQLPEDIRLVLEHAPGFVKEKGDDNDE